MKKTLGLLVLLFVIVLASPLGPARADNFTNGDIVTVTPSISEQDLETYNNALQVLEYLRQGGTIDFSNVSSGYQTGDLLDEFVDLIDTVGSGIDYYGNNFLNNIFDLSSDTVQLSPNTKLKDRIGQFRSNLPSYLNQNSSDIVTPNPDPNYVNYIRYINSYNVDLPNNFVMYYFNSDATYPNHWYFNGDGKNYSWVSYTRFTSLNGPNEFNFNIQNSICYQQNGLQYTSNVLPCQPISIYINGSDTNYSFTVNCDFVTNKFISEYDVTYTMACCNGFTGNWYRDEWFIYPVTDNPPSSNITYTGTLERCMMYIVQNFRNVNIYVNGVPWTLPFQPTQYNIALNTGTYLKETNQPIEYQFEIPVYVDISDLIDKIQLAIDNKITLDFPYLEDLIVDTNGQQTIAVTIFEEKYTLDDQYVKEYGAMIPVFPLFVEYPVSLQSINNVATVGIVDVVPDEILEIFGMFLVGGLFVLLCHRLME